MLSHFAHFGSWGPTSAGGIPFTQQQLHPVAAAGHHHLQLFHQQRHHKPQPSAPARWAPQHHHLGLDIEAAIPESSGAGGGSAASRAAAPPGIPPFLAAAMSFKLTVDASGSGGAIGCTDDALKDRGGGGGGMMLYGGGGNDEAATESQLQRWPGEEEVSIKEPTWYLRCH